MLGFDVFIRPFFVASRNTPWFTTQYNTHHHSTIHHHHQHYRSISGLFIIIHRLLGFVWITRERCPPPPTNQWRQTDELLAKRNHGDGGGKTDARMREYADHRVENVISLVGTIPPVIQYIFIASSCAHRHRFICSPSIRSSVAHPGWMAMGHWSSGVQTGTEMLQFRRENLMKNLNNAKIMKQFSVMHIYNYNHRHPVHSILFRSLCSVNIFCFVLFLLWKHNGSRGERDFLLPKMKRNVWEQQQQAKSRCIHGRKQVLTHPRRDI